MSETRLHDQHCAKCDEAEFSGQTYEATHRCGARLTGTQFLCDREAGHDGQHRTYDEVIDEPLFWPNVPRYTAGQLAGQRQSCMSMQAFLRRKGSATSNLRDATTYAEIAAVIDAYLEALEQLQGGGR